MYEVGPRRFPSPLGIRCIFAPCGQHRSHRSQDQQIGLAALICTPRHSHSGIREAHLPRSQHEVRGGKSLREPPKPLRASLSKSRIQSRPVRKINWPFLRAMIRRGPQAAFKMRSTGRLTVCSTAQCLSALALVPFCLCYGRRPFSSTSRLKLRNDRAGWTSCLFGRVEPWRSNVRSPQRSAPRPTVPALSNPHWLPH
jgi:hypothetical protein